ncbi:hypothetical protein BC830DRAFT_1077510 [Chytriomyces sp. MP71]|nr:hypothetical protein BC830DRAFT_1077510 [Chytriomyces sp. MP71]
MPNSKKPMIDTRRAEQVRLAQRNYRARKDQKLAEQAAEIEALKAQLASDRLSPSSASATTAAPSSPPSECPNCSAERQAAAESRAKIDALEDRIRDLEELIDLHAPWPLHHLEVVKTSPSSASTSSTPDSLLPNTLSSLSPPSASPVQPMDLSLTEPAHSSLFPHLVTAQHPIHVSPTHQGPTDPSTFLIPALMQPPPECAAALLGGPPRVEFYRKAFKLIPTLKDCPWVDTMCDNFVTQSYHTDHTAIRRFSVRILIAKFGIFDACGGNKHDLQRAVELVELSKQSSRHHVQLMYARAINLEVRLRIAAKYGPPRAQALLPGASEFMQAAKTVPSLREADDLLEDMCRLFSWQARCSDREERAEGLFAFVEQQARLENLCTEEDRIGFVLQIEKVRTAFKPMHDDMLARADLSSLRGDLGIEGEPWENRALDDLDDLAASQITLLLEAAEGSLQRVHLVRALRDGYEEILKATVDARGGMLTDYD